MLRLKTRGSQHRRHGPQDALDLPANILVLRDTASGLPKPQSCEQVRSEELLSAADALAHDSGLVVYRGEVGDGV